MTSLPIPYACAHAIAMKQAEHALGWTTPEKLVNNLGISRADALRLIEDVRSAVARACLSAIREATFVDMTALSPAAKESAQ